MPFCLEIRNLRKTYGEGRLAVEAIQDLSFNVAEGGFVSLLGPSASGKTTLLRILSSQEPSTSGEARYQGVSIQGMDREALETYRSTQVAVLTGEPPWIPSFTALENVALPLRLAGIGRKAAERAARESLARLGVEDIAPQHETDLALLERQLAALARALARGPRLLLADEPTARLDSASGARYLTLLRDLVSKDHLTVLLATPDREAADLGDTVMTLRDGRLTGMYPVGVARA